MKRRIGLDKGFTLIELLVTIAIIAVIAAAVLVAIDPVDKIASANDSRAQADIGQIATALTTFYVNKSSYPVGTTYPTDLATMTGTGDLTKIPVAPSTYTYGYSGTATTARVYAPLKSKKYSATPFFVWCNTSAGASAMSLATLCP
jgi:prepilin-type N-terminal cleavage/methylation domain-containing protein